MIPVAFTDGVDANLACAEVLGALADVRSVKAVDAKLTRVGDKAVGKDTFLEGRARVELDDLALLGLR
jgi:hypothetical protein